LNRNYDLKPEGEKPELFIGGLPDSVTIEELKEHFSYFGIVCHIKVIRRKKIGFVIMLKSQDAQNAITGLNGIEFHGKRIVVERALRKKNKSKV
jgi:RNA recognition motif-containing protein